MTTEQQFSPTILGDDFGCHLFKSNTSADLLLQIDDRIDLMELCGDEVTMIDGINIIELWRTLYTEIQTMWIGNMNTTIITLNKLQEIKLSVISDLVARFFLYNGSDVDNEFLKNIDNLFKVINENNKIMSTEQRWDMLKKAID